MEQDDPRLVAAARHALHDEELVAAYAVDGDAAEDPARARALIERCGICRDLHADLVAIGSTIKAAGTAETVGAVRAAPRDFRLSASDAVRLRGGNVLRRVAARLSDAIPTLGRPLGASLAALGLVGLLVGTMALAQLGSPAAMSTEGSGDGAAAPGATAATAPGPAAGATFEVTAGNQSLSTPPGDGAAYEPLSSARDSGGKGPATLDDRGSGPGLVALLFAGSIALLVAGGALLLLATRRTRRSKTGTTTRNATRT
jgi:hypothetical protein